MEKNAENFQSAQGKKWHRGCQYLSGTSGVKQEMKPSIQVVCMNVCVYVCGWGFMHTEMDLTQVVAPTVNIVFLWAESTADPVWALSGPISMWIWVHKALKLSQKCGNWASRGSHDAITVYLFIVWLQFPEDTACLYNIKHILLKSIIFVFLFNFSDHKMMHAFVENLEMLIIKI